MARYLVNGGCGFLGSHLTQALLSQGDEVVILDEACGSPPESMTLRADVVIGSVRDSGLVSELVGDVDGCFHLSAGPASDRHSGGRRAIPFQHQREMAALTEAVARQCSSPIPIVYASSAEIYGHGAGVALGEDSPPLPLTPRAIDQLAGEYHAARAGLIWGIPTIGFRLFDVYGTSIYGASQDAGCPLPGLVGLFAASLAERRMVPIPGDGSQERDFIFIDDVVAYLMAAMRHPPMRPEIFNLCTGTATTVMALADAMAKLIGEEPAYAFSAANPAEPESLVGRPHKLVTYFGFSPQVGLQRGLETVLDAMNLIEWF